VRAVDLPRALEDSIRRSAAASYPEECCGFVLGPAELPEVDGVRLLVAVAPASNRSAGERRRRFVILPEELREAERAAANRGLVVTGFYHSHPDHPARPSQFDQEHAWPWYVYLIVSSDRAGVASSPGAFELDPETREFRAIAVTSASTREAASAAAR
jgi:proteasome lid subunit RPN8/RPN11